MANIESIKRAILLEYKEQRKEVGDIIPLNYWLNFFIPNLTATEQDLFNEAMKELIDEGLIEFKSDAVRGYRLKSLL